MRNTLPKSGTFLLGHPVYVYLFLVCPYGICGLKHANGNMAAMHFATKQFWFSDLITD